MPEFIDDLEEYEASIDHLKLSGMKMKSLGGEKQISIDPISLHDSVSPGTKAKELDLLPFPNLEPPSEPKFLSYSVPKSATPSPRFGLSMLKKKLGNQNQAPALRVNPFYRQDSIALVNLERLRGNYMRSKSSGERRTSAPLEEFNLWLVKTNNSPGKNNHPKAEMKVEERKYDAETMEIYDEKFKCGALCLFLPGLVGKAKPVKARKEEPELAGHDVVSRRVSLAKFECGSWRSSTILNDNEADKDASNLFYDLPLEMIRCSVSDTHSPVTAAFVFDKDRKGVLKKSSSRHVRFSSSSPRSHPASPTSCVTPRLHKAREDFNAFLEAQTA